MSNKKKNEEELLQEQSLDTVNGDPGILRDTLLEELLQTQPFEFDLNADALYRQYRDSYSRQGEDAAADAFGKAASLTGGYANSYAQSVAAQTYDDYMLALQDKGLQIYENAYDRYKQENDRKADLYKLISDREKEEYDRLQEAEQEAYEREQTAEKAAYDKQQDILSFAYKMAQLGDFSYLEAAGVDISDLQAAAKEKENAPEKISVTIQNTAEETYYYYGYAALLNYLNRQIAYGQISEKGKNQIIKALTGRG
ncbi:MAG: hypothetical protein E7523_04705 [Ruminococcaceae bacterium]|nr:hypothetical protein [Oscillospiraceae bacterium]